MTLRVCDASAVVAMLTDSQAPGDWAASQLLDCRLAAPHLLQVEVASVLRRAAASRQISQDTAVQAYWDLLRLRLSLFPFRPFAQRVWELRGSLTTYDAWYVAIAERFDAGLVTLDQRLVQARGPRCKFISIGA